MNIVITGAGKGIGLELAKRYLQSPEHRVWACSRDISGLSELDHPALYAETLDITKVTEAHIAERVGRHFNRVDVLVHNAGILINRPFAETTLEDWQQVFDVNIFAVVRITRALLPLLRASGRAHVVHIGSMGGVQGTAKFPGLSAYSASKAALANLTECLAEELKPDGIYVNCLALGSVDTEMVRQAFPGYQASAGASEMARFIHDFSLDSRNLFNGKILQIASSTP